MICERELIEKRRQVLLLRVSSDVPVDELVHQYKPEAVYKVLPDARRKLKTGLQDRGLGIAETQTCLARLGKILADCETNRCKVKFQSGQ